MQLLLGSTNRGKAIEVQEALSDLPLSIVFPSEIGIVDFPHETGPTFAANAAVKARFYAERSNGIPTLADDSGLIVQALQDELGVQTRRWGAGHEASDEEWIDFFLRRMQQEDNKRARFTCALCFIYTAGNEHHFEGTCNGIITNTLEAEFLPGLPISACFKPVGCEKVYAALSSAEKNAVSHRGKALRQLRIQLQQLLGQ